MQTDEQLMLEFKRGSKEAFEELFSRYSHPIFGYFRRRLNHSARAEDLAQETFVIIILPNLYFWHRVEAVMVGAA